MASDSLRGLPTRGPRRNAAPELEARLSAVQVTRAVLRGFLSTSNLKDVNNVNVRSVAQSIGITVEEKKSDEPVTFNEWVHVQAFSNGQKLISAGGTFFGSPNNPRIVRLFSQAVEIPVTGTLLLISKETEGPATVFAADAALLDAGGGELREVGKLAVGPRVTAADISADGSQLVVRSYDGAWSFHRAPGTSVAAALTTQPPAPFAVPHGQEAIGFTTDGSSLLTIAEGQGAALWRLPVPRA